jgi:hypothetical protein
MAEFLRVHELENSGYITTETRDWMETCYALGKQFGSCFVGFPNGSLGGYRGLDANFNLTMIYGNGTTLFSYIVDYDGRATTLFGVENNYNATQTPWYVGSAMEDGFYLAPAYAYGG